jgi:hypothetical protein
LVDKATAENGTPERKPYQGAFLNQLDQEEKEIEELEAERNGTKQDSDENQGDEVKNEANEPEPESAEEKNWKKRYGDLRKHLQKKEDEYKKALDDSNKRIEKLEQSVKEAPDLPKTKEEVEQFKQEHKDVYEILKSIAKEELQEDRKDLDEKLSKLEEKSQQQQFEEAEKKLQNHVSDKWDVDLGTLQADEEFHAWVMEQPQWMQDAIYEGGTDWKSAGRVIDLYMLDNGTAQQKKQTRRKKEAEKSASTVDSKTNATEPKTKAKTLKESEVDRWSAEEFEQRESEIRQHIANGTFVYDLSAGAR